MKCLVVLPMLFIVVFGGGGKVVPCPCFDGTSAVRCCRVHIRAKLRDDNEIVEQVLSLCDTNDDDKLSFNEAKNCEVCNIYLANSRYLKTFSILVA